MTDDQGRYLVPDLPRANYDVWVRGYGLVDSPKVKATPGKNLNLKAVPAPKVAPLDRGCEHSFVVITGQELAARRSAAGWPVHMGSRVDKAAPHLVFAEVARLLDSDESVSGNGRLRLPFVVTAYRAERSD